MYFNTTLNPKVRPLDTLSNNVDNSIIIQAIDLELKLSLSEKGDIEGTTKTLASIFSNVKFTDPETEESVTKHSSASRVDISDELLTLFPTHEKSGVSNSAHFYNYPYVINNEFVTRPGQIIIGSKLTTVRGETAIICCLGVVIEKTTTLKNLPPKHLDFNPDNSFDSYVIRGLSYLPFYIEDKSNDASIYVQTGDFEIDRLEHIYIFNSGESLTDFVTDYQDYIKSSYFPESQSKDIMFCSNECDSNCTVQCVKDANFEPAFKLIEVLYDRRLSLLLEGNLTLKELIQS